MGRIHPRQSNQRTLYPVFQLRSERTRVFSEKDQLLLPVQALDFMRVELNLYLDTHPDDVNAINLFAQNQIALNEAKRRYEERSRSVGSL